MEKEELQKKLYDLHLEFVNKVVRFCKENNIQNADGFDVYADGLGNSIDYGFWTPATDSSFVIMDENRRTIIESI